MPPDRSPSHYTFDLNMLDPRVLNTPDGHNAALRAIERVCYRGEFEIEATVSALMSRSHILEYIFSGTLRALICTCASPTPYQPFRFPVLDENAYDKLIKWMISGFPTPTTPNMKDTMSMRILRRLSSSLLFAEYPSSAEAPPDLRVFWRNVEMSFNVLKELEECTNGGFCGGNTSPTSRRRSRQAFKSGRIDPLPFDSLGISVPTSDIEVRDAHIEVLGQLQSILEVRELEFNGLRGTKASTVLSPRPQGAANVGGIQILVHQGKPSIGKSVFANQEKGNYEPGSTPGLGVPYDSADEGRTLLR